MTRALIGVALLCVTSGHLLAQSQSAASCAALTALAIADVRIVKAAAVPAGPFTPPGAKQSMTLPAFCRVEAVATPTSDSLINFEVWMPAAVAWNGNFQAVGNGGFLGASTTGDGRALARGYATAGTDAGHVGGDLKFADGHPERSSTFHIARSCHGRCR